MRVGGKTHLPGPIYLGRFSKVAPLRLPAARKCALPLTGIFISIARFAARAIGGCFSVALLVVGFGRAGLARFMSRLSSPRLIICRDDGGNKRRSATARYQ